METWLSWQEHKNIFKMNNDVMLFGLKVTYKLFTVKITEWEKTLVPSQNGFENFQKIVQQWH